MPYKAILFKRNKDTNQYAIINDDNSAFFPNLSHNEFAIDILSSEYCPLNLPCIDRTLEEGISIYCEYFVGFFEVRSDHFSYKSFYCNRDEKYREVSKLKPVDCPNGKVSCIGCKKLIKVVPKPYPEKSNCHVVCG